MPFPLLILWSESVCVAVSAYVRSVVRILFVEWLGWQYQSVSF